MPLSEWPPPLAETSGNELPLIRTVPPGPRSRQAAARLDAVECPAFGQRRERRADTSGMAMDPIVLSHGNGANLHDLDGNRYVDLVAGFGAVLLGHASKTTARAMEAQAERLVQGLGDVYATDAKLALLERLATLHTGESPRVLLTQSGSDAVTGALKTAKLATGKPGIVAFDGAYHGLGYAPLAACGLRESYRAPFANQLNHHVVFAPYPRNDDELDASLGAVEKILRGQTIGAVLVEPILGRGGVVVPPRSFVRDLGRLANDHGALLIADEIWTAFGRSGAMVYSVEEGFCPDILCFGKGLGGGLALSACVAPEAIMRAWAREEEVIHTSTHAGMPLACAVAGATLDAVRFRKLDARAKEVGARTLATWREALAGLDQVREVRGAGLMLGIEMASPKVALSFGRRMLERGYLVLGGGKKGETITLTPPLVIEESLLEAAAWAARDALTSASA